MTAIPPPFSTTLPGFRTKANDIFQMRLEGGLPFRNYCERVSDLGLEIVSEGVSNYSSHSTNGYPGTFVIVGGSIARGEATSTSDLDFLALPDNPKTERDARELQQGLDLTFKSQTDLPLRFDPVNNFSRFHNFCIAPQNYPDSLLIDQIPFKHGDIIIETLLEDQNAHVAIRDFNFVAGDEDGFRKLMDICTPILYPYGDNNDLTPGEKLLAQMIKNSNALINDWEKEKTFQNGIKDSGLRLFQYFRLIISARENIKDSKSFYSVMDRSRLETQDADFLKNTYEKLLMLYEAKKLTKEKFKGNPILTNTIAKIEIEKLEQLAKEDFDRSIKIMRKYI